MSDNNDLFPFPTVPESEKADQQAKSSVSLPVFPGSSTPATAEEPLSSEELREIRILLASRRSIPCAEPNEKTPVDPPLPVLPITAVNAETTVRPEKILQQQLVAHLESIHLIETFEVEIRHQLIEIIEKIVDTRVISRVWAATSSILPIRNNLRHGTPDQKLFALIMLGERFLQSLSGINFTERKRLLKAVARYLSDVSETCSFIQMEGEPFNPQYHERAPGSTPSGKSVREMHGFLVTSRSSNQVVKTALVLT
ncbi:MAG: hypothetical protein ACD_39C00093G0002 [uncultured bacterium]|nr:MAG: hypothetical protein ACD_39C00093G0002 [uncultured bacterium]